MRSLMSVVSVGLLLTTLAGCSPKEAEKAPAPPKVETPAPDDTAAVPSSTGAALGSIKSGDKAICAVCAVKDGTTKPEEVKAVLDYKGKTYGFCNLEEKAEFISNPAKYAGSGK